MRDRSIAAIIGLSVLPSFATAQDVSAPDALYATRATCIALRGEVKDRQMSILLEHICRTSRLADNLSGARDVERAVTARIAAELARQGDETTALANPTSETAETRPTEEPNLVTAEDVEASIAADTLTTGADPTESNEGPLGVSIVEPDNSSLLEPDDTTVSRPSAPAVPKIAPVADTDLALAPESSLDPQTAGGGAGTDIDPRDLAAIQLLKTSTPELFETLLAEGVFDPPAHVLPAATQEILQSMSCYHMRVDGDWGRGSRRALQNYFDALPQAYPDVDVASLSKPATPSTNLYRTLLRYNEVQCTAPAVRSSPMRTAASRSSGSARSTTSRSTRPPSKPPIPFLETLDATELVALRDIAKGDSSATLPGFGQTDQTDVLLYLQARDRRTELFEDFAQADPHEANDLLKRLLGGRQQTTYSNRPTPPSGTGSGFSSGNFGGIFR